jgi:dephospho-CoA kinase
MIYCIALTGTIASGKSTAARFFKSKGIAVFSADDIAKRLTGKNTPVFSKIRDHFGPSVLTPNNELDRLVLRQLISLDSNQRLWLENLLHPLIREKIAEYVQLATGPYVVVEIPLLKSREHHPYLDRVLLIRAPVEHQIKRLMARDHCSEDEALKLLSIQPSYKDYLGLADDLVLNDTTPHDFQNKLSRLHLEYLKQAR